MVSHKHKCIFIHIPKCAGTSFENLLGHFEGHSGREGQDHRSIRMLQTPIPVKKALGNSENIKELIRRYREYIRKHANPNNKLMVNERQFDQYFKFSIVRNPWYRLHSWYRNVMRDSIHQKNYKIPANISFEKFIMSFAGTGFLRPQTYWLKDFDGKVKLDFIGKFESLDDSFMRISQALDISADGLPHNLKSKQIDISTDFTVKAVNFINDYYAEEIEMFDYSFD